MAKKRVHEIAKAKGLTSKEVLAALKAAGIEAKAAQSSVEESDALAALKAGNGSGAAEAKREAEGQGEGQAREGHQAATGEGGHRRRADRPIQG